MFNDNKMRFDIIPIRNQANLEIFVNNHIEPGTLIVTDGWKRYRFLDNNNTSVWEHKLYIHGRGQFGYGKKSTSHIEDTWDNLKQEIKSLFGSLPNRNFIYFLGRENFV
jgi:hypothetical protein